MRPIIDYGSRSSHDAEDWICTCGRPNLKVQKLIFAIPTFKCPCGRKYLDTHDFNFCLADITINGQYLVQRVLDQEETPECMAFACVHALQIMLAVDALLKEEPVPGGVDMDPADLYDPYNEEYPYMKYGCEALHIEPDSRHKILRMVKQLKKEGISLGEEQNGKFYAIGDACTIPMHDYEKMCEELADGVPLLACFLPGATFEGLEYCRVYYPADANEVADCNEKPDPHKKHAGHMVVLIGPAFTKLIRGWFFINSAGEIWCPREILEERPEPDDVLSLICSILEGTPQGPRAVRGGIGKVHETGFVWNHIKFCRPGEPVGDERRRLRLEDENDEDESLKYLGSHYNYFLLDQ